MSLRENLRSLGTNFFCESAVAKWHGNRAEVMDLLDGSITEMDFDSIVLSTINVSCNELEQELDGQYDFEIHVIGDCLSPRQAPAATYEGRKIGRQL